VPASDEEILKLNGGAEASNHAWPHYEDARKVLNYRHHIHQGNPPNKDWDHIVEQSGRGVHSDTNLALADSNLNRVTLNNWFGERQISGPGFPNTGPLTVREYLDSIKADATERTRWKMRAYRIFRVSIR